MGSGRLVQIRVHHFVQVEASLLGCLGVAFQVASESGAGVGVPALAVEDVVRDEAWELRKNWLKPPDDCFKQLNAPAQSAIDIGLDGSGVMQVHDANLLVLLSKAVD